ncbi:MAG: lipopolysaccharide heptosyltransferase II, partial [Candidatus Omnitrophica bacterium]|nr:lipopolysaccharide heptosyltransferase II [Candidatus Omnitrophota bacterium]
YKVILVGDSQDCGICQTIKENSQYPLVDLSGQTSILELAALVKRSSLVVSNDSALLHIAGYLDIPTAVVFGPTDDLKYGPWSGVKVTAKKELYCRPCQKAQCEFGTLDCLKLVKPSDLLEGVKNILNRVDSPKVKPFKRILIARTDRIGDVVLSTPVIKAIRENYPHAYIAVLVSPYAKEIVEGNPYLDEVIVYDKDKLQRGLMGSIKFARLLKKKKFDLALILHPNNRTHLITFFAAIPRRLGYDRKFHRLLTDKIKHTKQLGQKHETEYTLDFIRYLGIEPASKSLYMPIKKESEEKVDKLFEELSILKTDKLLAVHPAASCPSRIWPNDRFAAVADKLIEKYGFKVLILAASKDKALAEEVKKHMSHQAINLAGETSISMLASVLKRCQLFISNDSGPVHIAAALGTPVISIFGRNQPGLSPLRWAPLGPKARTIHKNVGCVECLAHNCLKGFACLKAIKVEEVISIADEILKNG